MAEVPRIATHWTNAELLAAYDAAYRDIVGEEPSRAALAALWAQASLECGRNGQSCWCHNVGNLRGSAPDGSFCIIAGAYEFAPTGRVPAGARIISPPAGAAAPPGQVCYLPAASQQRFQAFDGFLAGCRAKLSLLTIRWPAALDALRAARDASAARAYVLGLIVPPPYFTGDSAGYMASLLSLAAECLRTTPEEDWPRQRDTLPSPPGDTSITVPDAPSPIRRASSQSMPRVNAPIIEGGATIDADDGKRLPARAGTGNHEPEDPQ